MADEGSDAMKRTIYLRDMGGRVVKDPRYRPSGDQDPNGRAATRRRKQMARQAQKMTDAWEKAGSPPVLVSDEAVEELHMRLPQEAVGPIELVPLPPDDPRVPPSPMFVSRAIDVEALAALMTAKPGQVIPIDPATFARMVKAGTASVGVDLGSPEGDVTTVALRKDNEILILDEAAQVPQHVWDEMGADVSRRINERIASELGGGTPPPVNKVVTRKGRRMGLGLARGVLAAALLGVLGTDKPKE